MKESFVFHESYIKHLPKDAISTWTLYIIEYGLYGKEPPIEKETFENTVWQGIKERIDAETEKYKEISEKRKEAAKKRYEKYYANKTNTEKTDDFINQSENQSEKTESTVKNKKFEKPTVEEIKEYCKERNNKINANQFYDFYESKDWKVGNQKMKNWQACIRTWEVRDKNSNFGKPKNLIGNEGEVPEEYFSLM